MESTNSNMMVWVIYMVVIFAAMYFMLIRPNKKKKQEEEKLRNSLQIGDEITTIGGIEGKIVSIKEDTDSIIIETSVEHNKLKLKRWAIASNNTVHEQEKTNNK